MSSLIKSLRDTVEAVLGGSPDECRAKVEHYPTEYNPLN